MRVIGTWSFALTLVALGGCSVADGPPASEEHALVQAVQRTYEEGVARSVSTFPAGVSPTVEASGLEHFSGDSSFTLFEIVDPDGSRVPFQRLSHNGDASGMAVLLDERHEHFRAVTEQRGFSAHVSGVGLLGHIARQAPELSLAENAQSRWVRTRPPRIDAPGATALWIHAVTLDSRDRIKRIEFEITNMEGVRTLTFYFNGEVPPHLVPAREIYPPASRSRMRWATSAAPGLPMAIV